MGEITILRAGKTVIETFPMNTPDDEILNRLAMIRGYYKNTRYSFSLKYSEQD